MTDSEVGRRTGRQPVRVAERTGYVNARTRLDYAAVGPACGLISGGIAGGWTWTRVGELATSSGASPWRRSTASVRARRTARAPRAAMTAAPAGAAASHGHCGDCRRPPRSASAASRKCSVACACRCPARRPRPGRPRQPRRSAASTAARALPPRSENLTYARSRDVVTMAGFAVDADDLVTLLDRAAVSPAHIPPLALPVTPTWPQAVPEPRSASTRPGYPPTGGDGGSCGEGEPGSPAVRVARSARSLA